MEGLELENFIKFHNKFDNFLAVLASISLFVMMILVSLDVALRNLFNKPIIGTLEITGEYLMVFIVYFAISYTHKHKEHVSVDLLENIIPKFLEKYFSIFTTFLSLVTFVLLGYYNFKQGLIYIERETTSRGLLEYPLWPALMVISLGIISLCVRLIFDSIKIMKENEENNT